MGRYNRHFDDDYWDRVEKEASECFTIEQAQDAGGHVEAFARLKLAVRAGRGVEDFLAKPCSEELYGPEAV